MFRETALGIAGLVTASCGVQTADSRERAINPLNVAEAYVRDHHPERLPKGLERAWYVEDHGDIWTVELFTQGMNGGGTRMAISKADGKVLGSEPTQ